MTARGRTIRAWLGVVAAVGLALTLAVAVAPSIRVAYRNPTLHAVIETASAAIGALIAYLMFGRFRQRRQLGDLALVYGFATLAVANLLFAALARVIATNADVGQATTWMLIGARVVGAGLIMLGALAGSRPADAGSPGAGVVMAVAAGIAVLVALFVVVAAEAPQAVEVGLEPESSNRPQFTTSPVVVGLTLVPAALFAVAAEAFVRRSEDTDDRLYEWLAAGCVLAALSKVNYALFPSQYSRWVYVGDVVRLGAYVLWLIGAAREVASYWQSRASSLALEERRRLASDIHDGLAQELAFVVTQARELTHEDDDRRLAHLASAAERALDESRRTITTLSTVGDERLDAAITRATDDVATRTGAQARFEIDSSIDAGPAVRESLVRIVREAVTNAVRHGEAKQVTVRLSGAGPHRLEISDDGSGFDPEHASRNPDSFGITSMRERARAMGGVLELDSAPGRGAKVTVTWKP